MNTKVKVEYKTEKMPVFKHFCMIFIVLFCFWSILSGHFDFKHLAIGAVTSLIVAWITLPLLCIPSTTTKGTYFMAFSLPIIKLVRYGIWLLVEVVKANIHVALLVLNPKMPIDPYIVTFNKEMSNPIAHAALANSITLTPGTITVDVVEGEYIVHAITKEHGYSLAPDKGEGDMPVRIAKLFNEQEILAKRWQDVDL